VVTIGLSLQPLYQFWLRQQALDPLMPVAGGEVQLGGHIEGALLPRLYAIEAFAIEPYEVTNRRYRLCMQAGVCSPPNAPVSTYSRLGSDEYPIVKVTALQAAQFCGWLGLRLPTDQEWERAARYADGRLWPWGDDPPSPARANFYFSSQPELVRVGQTPGGVSEEGIYDLAGNVWEWTRSPYEFDDPVWEDTSVDPPVSLSLRGGGANISPETLQNIAFRVANSPTQSDPYIGFRCAVSR
jgi:formylglycine-generating enzyme required for sulfatase activity